MLTSVGGADGGGAGAEGGGAAALTSSPFLSQPAVKRRAAIVSKDSVRCTGAMGGSFVELTAGASTSDEIIDRVEARLRQIEVKSRSGAAVAEVLR